MPQRGSDAAPKPSCRRAGPTRAQQVPRSLVSDTDHALEGALEGALDAALEDALARVRELSLRLWAVREAHRPVRSLLGRARCWTCGQPYPCPTLQAAGPPTMRRSA